MAEEKEKKEEMVPVTAEYEVVDQVDDQAIIELMTGQTIQDYVYSFKQGGRTVEGLTLAGINEAANRRGGIQVEEIEYEELENSWIATAKAVDTITGSSRYGAYEQAKMSGGRSDPFAFTKAIHKAQRNAIKQLIPVPVIREVLNFYLHRKAGSGNSAPQQQIPQGGGNIAQAQKATFAIAANLSDPLEKKGITKADLWNYMKRKCGVESRNDINEMQWTQLSAELKAAETTPQLLNDLCERIKQLTTASQESEVPAPEEPADQDTAASNETEGKTAEAQGAPF
ncbi:hypothetical protein C6503_05310 [Candidatus Poribacteria bacterium]|nr:MAG: hypothetical protein C6503_05310 [Candidatus Poribacteria bacterium]